jgi:hypothetical protein
LEELKSKFNEKLQDLKKISKSKKKAADTYLSDLDDDIMAVDVASNNKKQKREVDDLSDDENESYAGSS